MMKLILVCDELVCMCDHELFLLEEQGYEYVVISECD